MYDCQKRDKTISDAAVSPENRKCRPVARSQQPVGEEQFFNADTTVSNKDRLYVTGAKMDHCRGHVCPVTAIQRKKKKVVATDRSHTAATTTTTSTNTLFTVKRVLFVKLAK